MCGDRACNLTIVRRNYAIVVRYVKTKIKNGIMRLWSDMSKQITNAKALEERSKLFYSDKILMKLIKLTSDPGRFT